MLEVLKFVFSSFWIWAGTMLLLLCLGSAINSVLVGFWGKPSSIFGSDDDEEDEKEKSQKKAKKTE